MGAFEGQYQRGIRLDSPQARRLEELLLRGSAALVAREVLEDRGWELDLDGDYKHPTGVRLVRTPEGQLPNEENIKSAVELLEAMNHSLGCRIKSILGKLAKCVGLGKVFNSLIKKESPTLRLVGEFTQEQI